jgi:hypothetical protein
MATGMRALLSALCFLACVACSGAANGEKMSNDDKTDAAWQEVLAADTAERQRERIDAFLAMNQAAGAPALQVSVKDIASGQKAPIDKALWANPQQYEVTLRYGEQTYTFTPKSRSSLEPLFRE